MSKRSESRAEEFRLAVGANLDLTDYAVTIQLDEIGKKINNATTLGECWDLEAKVLKLKNELLPGDKSNLEYTDSLIDRIDVKDRQLSSGNQLRGFIF